MNNMKDSGVEWIGKIPESWSVRKFKFATTIHEEKYTSGNYQYIALENIESFSGKYIHSDSIYDLAGSKIANTGDVIFGKLRPYLGKVFEITEKVCVSNEFAIFHGKLVNSHYLKYYMINSCFVNHVTSSTYGTKMPRAHINFISSCFITVPSPTDQEQIVHFLDNKCSQIDALIANTGNQIAKLKQYKQSLITEAVTKGLDPTVPMKDSGVEWIGKIPKSWRIIRLKHLYDYSNGSPVRVGPFGSALPSSDITNQGVWVYNQRTVLDQNFITNNTFVSEEKASELSGFAVHPKDILITTRGSIGKTAIVPDSAPKGILHPCVIRFRIDSKKMDNALLSLIFNETNICLGQIMDMSNSTTIEVLYSYSLKAIWIPCPPTCEQCEVLERVRELIQKFDRLIELKQSKIEKLEEYKKSLIYEYVTGKKEVEHG